MRVIKDEFQGLEKQCISFAAFFFGSFLSKSGSLESAGRLSIWPVQRWTRSRWIASVDIASVPLSTFNCCVYTETMDSFVAGSYYTALKTREIGTISQAEGGKRGRHMVNDLFSAYLSRRGIATTTSCELPECQWHGRYISMFHIPPGAQNVTTSR